MNELGCAILGLGRYAGCRQADCVVRRVVEDLADNRMVFRLCAAGNDGRQGDGGRGDVGGYHHAIRRPSSLRVQVV